MLKTTGSSIVSAFRVDDNEVVGSGGGAGAENGGSIVEQKVDSITSNNWLDSRGRSYKKSPTSMPTSQTGFLQTCPDSLSTLGSMIMLSN